MLYDILAVIAIAVAVTATVGLAYLFDRAREGKS